MEETCDNCMRQLYCGGSGKRCFHYQTIQEKMNMLHFSMEEWEDFAKQWEKARSSVRKGLGYR